MRESLNNTRNILRQRRDVPSSAFGTWKLNNSRLKEQIFYQPIFPGRLFFIVQLTDILVLTTFMKLSIESFGFIFRVMPGSIKHTQ